MVVILTFNPNILQAESSTSDCEFKANLVYIVSSRTTRAVTHINPLTKAKN